MIAALAFYQLLATASFTLLGLWFVVGSSSWPERPTCGWPTPNARRPCPHPPVFPTASEE